MPRLVRKNRTLVAWLVIMVVGVFVLAVSPANAGTSYTVAATERCWAAKHVFVQPANGITGTELYVRSGGNQVTVDFASSAAAARKFLAEVVVIAKQAGKTAPKSSFYTRSNVVIAWNSEPPTSAELNAIQGCLR